MTDTAPGKQSNPEAPPEPLGAFTERLAPKFEQVTARLNDTNERVKTFIRENPGSCLLGAAALGFALGRWASRR